MAALMAQVIGKTCHVSYGHLTGFTDDLSINAYNRCKT